MGNMGFASNICAKEPIDFVNEKNVVLDFSCQHTTQISKLLSSGMMIDLAFFGTFKAVTECYVDPNN